MAAISLIAVLFIKEVALKTHSALDEHLENVEVMADDEQKSLPDNVIDAELIDTDDSRARADGARVPAT